MKLKIKKGDTVKIISGASVGQQGLVLDIDKKNSRVTVEGIMAKKHIKPQTSKANPDGGIVEISKSIHISNVALIDPKSGETTKVGRKEVDGKLVRYAKKSGEVLN